MKRTVPLAIFILLTVFGAFPEPNDYQLHDLIMSIKEPRGCEVWQDYLLFTFRPEKKARHVGITFEHENFGEIHLFTVNPHGVYYYLMPLPADNEVSYRLVVDGIWLTDPLGQGVSAGHNGTRLSRFLIPAIRRPIGENPSPGRDGFYEFKIELPRGRNVVLAGDFNGWDPYMTRLKETPGNDGRSLYTVSLRVSRGVHYYWFVIDGDPMPDPSNPEIARTRFGETVSVFTAR